MKREILFSILAILAMAVVLVLPAEAQQLTQGFSQLVKSNIALFAGLALALFGLYEILVAQNTAVGIGMIVFGLVIAFVPNIFGGLFDAVKQPLQSFGSEKTNLQ